MPRLQPKFMRLQTAIVLLRMFFPALKGDRHLIDHVLGRLGDRLGPLRFLIFLTLYLAILCVLWGLANGFVALAIFAVLFGAANGGCIALYPAVAATWFGTRNLGAILGALYIAVGIAALAGGSVAGLLFDLYGSYKLSIMLAGACALVSAVAVWLAGRNPVRPAWFAEVP